MMRDITLAELSDAETAHFAPPQYIGKRELKQKALLSIPISVFSQRVPAFCPKRPWIPRSLWGISSPAGGQFPAEISLPSWPRGASPVDFAGRREPPRFRNDSRNRREMLLTPGKRSTRPETPTVPSEADPAFRWVRPDRRPGDCPRSPPDLPVPARRPVVHRAASGLSPRFQTRAFAAELRCWRQASSYS